MGASFMASFGRPRKEFLLPVLMAGIGGLFLLAGSAFPTPKHKLVRTGVASPSLGHSTGNPSAAELLGRLPIAFERNVGQADSRVQFLSRAPSAVVSLGSREMWITLANPTNRAQALAPRAGSNPHSSPRSVPHSIALQVNFLGAPSQPQLEGLDPLPTKTNYYMGRDPSLWHTNIANYASVRYHEVYPGIDLLFHGKRGHLEYDFVVAPGADPGVIQMEIRGARRVRLSAGAVLLETSASRLRFERPLLYQERNGKREYVGGEFVLLGANRVGFRVGRYDRSRPLIIDPVLSYGTFLSGSNSTRPAGIAVNSAGEIYVAGSTFATDFPTASAAQGQNGGYEDAFVAKISSTGTTLVFSTYLGGNNFDDARGIALDPLGNAYLLGVANSSNFPTTPGSFRTSCPANFPSCSAPFVAKFGPTGMLDYSTLLSPGANAKAIAVDSQGSTYVTGGIGSNTLDVVNAFQSQYQGISSTSTGNAFVQKLDPTGSTLIYSTYLAPVGGPSSVQETMGLGIAVDASGSAHVTGRSTSTNFPTKNISPTLNSGHGIFLVKFKPDGSDLVYSASIAGSGRDEADGIALDGTGNAYLTGLTSSTDFPVTPGAFLATCTPIGTGFCSASSQIFALEVSADGSSLLYSTLLGSGFVGGIAVDSSGRAYITGTTAQPMFPVVNPIQANLQVAENSNTDAFVMALDSSGFPFFSTFLGGAGTIDNGTGIAADAAGNIFVTGITSGASNLFPVLDFPLLNPGQTLIPCCGVDGGFVAKISPASSGPVLSVAPRYAPMVVVRNVGSSPLDIRGFASTSSNPLGGDCLPAHTLAPGTGCFLVVGSDNADSTLAITSNAPGSPHQFTIRRPPSFGMGRPAQLLVTSTNFLNFPTQLVGTSSAPQSVILTNIGTAPSTIDAINFASGSFTQTNDCPASLNPGAHCTIQVTFTPTDAPSGNGDLYILHELGAQRKDVFVSGSIATNALVVSSPSLQFGPQYVGTTYLPRTLVLTNVGSAPLGLTGQSLSGPYTQTNNCPASLLAGSDCRVLVSFNPTGNGEFPGTLTITHNSVGGPQTIQLGGTGIIRSDLSVSPLQVNFPGNTIIGQTAGPQTLTLQNTSSQPVSISSVSITPSVFAISGNTCPATLSPGASCTISETFTPIAEGPVSGSLTIVHSGAGNPQVVSLSGTGVTQLRFTPVPVNFGDQQVGSTSAWHYLSVGNNTNSPVTIQSVSVSGDFQIAQNPCPMAPAQLQGFFGCAIQLTFTPSVLGTHTGRLTLTASDSPTPHEIPLAGNGVSDGLEISPASLNFGDVLVGSSSPWQSLTVRNISGGSVDLQSISLTGPFSQTNNCGTALALGATCTVRVSFVPTVLGSASGTLTIQDNAAGSPHTAALQGTGFGSAVSLSPSNLIFRNQATGTTSPPLAVTLTNHMASLLSISGITVSGDFAQTNNCGSSLSAGASCTIDVTFRPTAQGLRTGSLAVADDAPGSPQTVALSGNGTAVPSVSLSATSVNFGGVLLNQQSGPQNITLSVSNAPLTIQSINFTSPLFSQQNSCPVGIAAGGNCTINIFFKPNALGTVNATMQIQDDAANSPQSVQITGSGSQYVLLEASGSGQVISAGQAASFTVSLYSLSGLNETVSLGCSGAPPMSTCSLSRSSFSLNGNPQQFNVTVTTTPRSTGAAISPVGWSPRSAIPWSRALAWSGAIWAAVCLLFLASGLSRRQVHPYHSLHVVLPVAFLVTLALGMLSCGGGGSSGPPPGTPAGTYTISVTGSSSNPANPTQTLPLVFTVK